MIKGSVFALTTAGMMAFTGAAAADDDKWYATLYGGPSFLGGQSFTLDSPNGAFDGTGDYSTGWGAGVGIGYRVSDRFSTEFAWMYTRNSNKNTGFTNGDSFSGGDFASNLFFLNGYYHFETDGRFKPYVGAGLGYAEEIDMDIQDSATAANTAFSDSGKFGFQLIAGAEVPLSDNWALTGDVRYIRFSGLDMAGADGVSTLNNVTYDPVTVTAGLRFKF